MNKNKKTHILIDYTSNELDKHAYEYDNDNEIKMTTSIIEVFGSEEIQAIMVPEQIKLKIRFENRQKLHICYQYIEGFISALVTEDPTKVHFDIVRTTLKNIDPILLEDKGLVDMLARELIGRCRSIILKLKMPAQIQDFFKKADTKETVTNASGRFPLALKIIELDLPPTLESLLEKNDMFICDNALLSVLENTGKKGNEAAKKYTEVLQNRLKSYNKNGTSPLDFWFNTIAPTPDVPFHTSPALQFLTLYIYEDIVKKKRNYGNKYPPALPTNIHSSVNIIHKGKIKEIDNQIQVFNEGSLIGTMAAIDPSLYNYVFRGVEKFRTVTGHRLLRFLPQKAHDQLANGINPCNILYYPGGYAQIADELNLNGKKVISDLKDLFHGLAFMIWNFQDFRGNFIALGEYKQAVTRNQNLGVKITLGPEFSPYYASKYRALLIPITKDPILVGPTQFYANQYLLQNEIMAEFSNQSIRLAEDGIVLLSDDIWSKAYLPQRICNLVKSSWTQDNDKGERFLEQIEKNAYTLGPAYQKELNFLKEQGEIRKKRSKEALLAKEKNKNK